MKVTRAFMADFDYLANRYGWNAEDINEVKAATRADPDRMTRYWSLLAAAHRAGYEQTRENGFIRLHTWCAEQGWPDPSTTDFIDGGGAS